MTKLKRIVSKNNKKFIDVIKSENGFYELQQYIKKFDPEEESDYEIRELPGPTGIYGDLDTAINEAERLMEFN